MLLFYFRGEKNIKSCWLYVRYSTNFVFLSATMSRILAIDYGRKRTGIAVSDPLQIIASGLTTVPTHQLMDFLLNYIKQEQVECIIIGHPKQLNNEDSENMKNYYSFYKSPEKRYCLICRYSWLMNVLLLF